MITHPNRGRAGRAMRAELRARRLGYDVYQGQFTSRWYVLTPAGRSKPAAPPGGFESAEAAWLAAGSTYPSKPGSRRGRPRRREEACKTDAPSPS